MSIRINADTDRAEIGLWSTFGNTTSNPWTIMGWFKLVNSRGSGTFASQFGVGSGGTDFVCQHDGSTGLLNFYDGGAYDSETFALSVGTWYHLAVTRAASGGTMQVYVDGTLRISNSNFNAVTGSPPKLTIGYDSFGGDWLDGEFVDWRVWQAELTSGEIAAEKASTTPVKASPYAYWRLASAATAATDGSGNSRSLTVSGLSDGASEPTIYAAAAPAVPSRRKKNTIHPGRHPDRFGKRLRTRRNNNYAGLGTITGTASPKLGNDTSTAAGTPVIKGSAAVTTGPDTSQAVGTAQGPQPSRRKKNPVHPGKGPYNFARFKKSARNTATALSPLTGTASPTLGNDTSAATGTPVITGAAAKTLAGDTSSATGTPIVTGSASVTLGADTLTASGKPVGTGSAAPTTGADTSTASGTPVVKGAAAPTLGNDTSVAAGGSIYGSASITLGDDTAQGRGDAGSSSQALGGAGWQGTYGERRKKRDEIDEILEAAEEKAEAILSAPPLEGAQTQEAKALERDVRALQAQLQSLQAQIAAAQDRAIRSEIDRLIHAIEETEAQLTALAIEDDNAAFSMILGMVL